MQGVFRQVQDKLKQSIQALAPDQYFYIIFFGGDRLYEFGAGSLYVGQAGRLLRASPKAKSAAYNFIDSIKPWGQTNAWQALQRAVQIRDSKGGSPSVIYFLTDGFELTEQDAHKLPQKVAELLREFAPTAKINTIGFWPASTDREILQSIAEQTGGQCILITGK